MLSTRNLGRQGLEVSMIDLDCMGMSQSTYVRDPDGNKIAAVCRGVQPRAKDTSA